MSAENYDLPSEELSFVIKGASVLSIFAVAFIVVKDQHAYRLLSKTIMPIITKSARTIVPLNCNVEFSSEMLEGMAVIWL